MDPYIGEIKLFPYNRIPEGWLLCDGSELAINGYEALYSLLGTTFGGNGTSTFKIPDLRGRVPVHPYGGQTNPSRISIIRGEYMGAEKVTLQGAHLPAHTHSVSGEDSVGNSTSPVSRTTCLWAIPVETETMQPIKVTPFSSGQVNARMDPALISNTGGGQAHDNMQPFIVLNFCIAFKGYYPFNPNEEN